MHASGLMPGADGPVWHPLSTDRVLQEEKVGDHVGLSSAEAASRAQRFGPNKFDTEAVRRSSAATTQNHPGEGDDTPKPLAQDLGTGSNRAGPDSGHASLPAA